MLKKNERCLTYYFIATSFSLLLKKQLAAKKKMSLLQVAATLTVAAATSNLARVSVFRISFKYLQYFVRYDNLQQNMIKNAAFCSIPVI